MKDFKGIWIPAKVWLAEDLKLIEKIFLVQINHLDNEQGCFATNKYFSDFFGVSKSRCTQIIKELSIKKYISISLIYEEKIISKRVLKILNRGIKLFKGGIKNIELGCLENCEGGIKNIESGYLENCEHKDTNLKDTNLKTLIEEESAHAQEKFDIEIFDPKIQDSEKEKNCAKKEKEIEYYQHNEMPPHKLGYQYSKNRVAKQKGSAWSLLDINLSSYKLPKHWTKEFTEFIIYYWRYCEEKKGVNWGTIPTILFQVESIEDYLLKFSEKQIMLSIKECIKKGDISFDPQWKIDRIKKEKAKQERNNQEKNNSSEPSFMLGLQ